MDEENEKDAGKLDAVTTFKLTLEMSSALDALKGRDGCSKDAMIRRLIQYGMKVDAELQKFVDTAARQVAMRKMSKTKKVSLKAIEAELPPQKGGGSRS